VLVTRAVFFLLLLSLAWPSISSGITESGSTTVHHTLEISLYPDQQRLSGIDTIALNPQGKTELLLALNRSAQIQEVSIAGQPAGFSFVDGRLTISIPPEKRAMETTLIVMYSAFFRDRPHDHPAGFEDPSYGVQGIISPQGVFLQSAANWYPDLLEGAATFRLRVQAPAGIEAITTGKRLERTTAGDTSTSLWDISYPVRGLALSAGEYVVQESASEAIPLYTYLYPQDTSLAAAYLNASANYLRFYQDLLGPYPFDKFAVVENFFPTGYGSPSYTLLGSSVIRLPFIIETSLGHEIAHSWWGNGVWVDYRRGNWSEGLTTYLSDYLYQERSSPEAGREYRMKILRDYATLVPQEKDFPLGEFKARTDPASQAIGYGKGAMVFHMARQRVGDEAFWQGLRQITQEKLFHPASWEDFAAAFQESSSLDMKRFFAQWVDQAGAPRLRLEGVSARQQGKGWKVSGRIVQEPPYYDLHIPLRLEGHGGDVNTIIPMNKEEATFDLSTANRPVRLAVDPGYDLFRRLAREEIPPTVNSIRGSTSLLAVVAGDPSPDELQTVRTLLAGLSHPETPILREANTLPQQLKAYDILYFAMPGRKGHLPPAPEDLFLAPDHFRLHGKLYDTPADALFATLPHPNDSNRVVAIFLPLSSEAGQMTVGKIPHYGNYSYLIFRNAQNLVKGTWSADASPTRWNFISEDRARASAP
jgi:aminopeptidase N